MDQRSRHYSPRKWLTNTKMTTKEKTHEEDL
jgi:hypothetical protein